MDNAKLKSAKIKARAVVSDLMEAVWIAQGKMTRIRGRFDGATDPEEVDFAQEIDAILRDLTEMDALVDESRMTVSIMDE